MTRRTNSNPVNENWTKESTIKYLKANAKEVLAECKKEEAKRKVIYVPSDTIRKTYIRKFID